MNDDSTRTPTNDEVCAVVLESLQAVNADASRPISLHAPVSVLLPDSLTAVSFALRVEKMLGRKVAFNAWMIRNARQMDRIDVSDLVDFVHDQVSRDGE